MFRKRRKVLVSAHQFSASELGRRGIAISQTTGLYAVEISVQGAKGYVSCIFRSSKSSRGKELTLKPLRFREGVLRGVAHVPKGEVRWGIYVHNQLVAEGGLVVQVVPVGLPEESIPKGMGGIGNDFVRFWFCEEMMFSVTAVMVEMADDRRTVTLKRGVDGWKGFGKVADGWFRFRVVGETGILKGGAMNVTEIGWDLGASSEWGMVSHWCRMEGGVAEVVKVEEGGTAWGGKLGIRRDSKFWERGTFGWKATESCNLISGEEERNVQIGEYQNAHKLRKRRNAPINASQRMMFTYTDTNSEIVALSVKYQAVEPQLDCKGQDIDSMGSLARRPNLSMDELMAEAFANAEMGHSPKHGLTSTDGFSTALFDSGLPHQHWPLNPDIRAASTRSRMTDPSILTKASKTSKSPPFHTLIREGGTTTTPEPWERSSESVLRSWPPYALPDRSGSSSPMSASHVNEQSRSPRIFDRAARMLSSLRSYTRSSKASTWRTMDAPTSGGRTPPNFDEGASHENRLGPKQLQKRVAEGWKWKGMGQQRVGSMKEQTLEAEEERFARGADGRNWRAKDVLVEVGKVLAVAFLTLAAERLLSRRTGDSRRQSLDGRP